MEDSEAPPGVDPTTPSPARMYDYMLGGTHNFQADRDATEAFRAQMPDLEDAAWANRGFHGRAAVWMAQQGIRQFIDLGSGLPTQNNTHEAVQKVAAGIHVVYVDNDPIVAAYGKALLTGDHTTTVVTADLRDPDSVLGHQELRELIDFGQPTGVLMTAVLQFVADGSDPWGLAARYMAAMAPGSYLALSHITYDDIPPQVVQAGREVYSRATAAAYPRSKAEVQRFFDGLQIVPPYPGAEASVVHVGSWGAEDPELADSDGSRAFFCAVARRP
jgi:hypothetical protein